MVAEAYVRSRKLSDPTLMIEELGKGIVPSMAEYCAKEVLARQKGEVPPHKIEIREI